MAKKVKKWAAEALEGSARGGHRHLKTADNTSPDDDLLTIGTYITSEPTEIMAEKLKFWELIGTETQTTLGSSWPV